MFKYSHDGEKPFFYRSGTVFTPDWMHEHLDWLSIRLDGRAWSVALYKQFRFHSESRKWYRKVSAGPLALFIGRAR